MAATSEAVTAGGTTSTEEDVLVVENLTVEFPTPAGPARAVDDVSLTVRRGERVAIVGESGSGKSVFSLALMGVVAGQGRITAGSVALKGRDVLTLSGEQLRRTRGHDIAMVFQDPSTSLNPVMTVADQIIPPIRRHLHLGVGAARARALELLRQTGIPDPVRNLRAYPHQLSGGMRQRVMIAIALSCNPDVLLADEPTTALDVTIQAQIVALLQRLGEEHSSAVVFITHDMGLVARFADRVAVMYAGRIVEEGAVRQIFADPSHPYTRGLLASIPAVRGPLPERLPQIEGTPPRLTELPRGCSFVTRCRERVARCHEESPPLIERPSGGQAACWVDSPAVPVGGAR